MAPSAPPDLQPASVDNPVTAPEGAGGGTRGAAVGNTDVQRPGTAGGRSVSRASPQRCPESLAESAGKGAVGDAGTMPRDLRSRQIRAASTAVDSAAVFVDRPWLNARQNASRRALNARLDALRERTDLSPQVKQRLEAAFSQLCRVERDLLRIDEWQALMRTRSLKEHEWGRLGDRVERVRSSQPTNECEAAALRELLNDPVALSPQTRELCRDLRFQLVLLQAEIGSSGACWHDLVARVEVPLPDDSSATAAVESRGTPGDALARFFVAGYRWNDADSVIEKALYGHVPELAVTALYDAHGELLFGGLRAGLSSLPAFYDSRLCHASDPALRALNDVLKGNFERVVDSLESGPLVPGEQHLEELRDRLRANPMLESALKAQVQMFGSNRMVMETVAAAMVTAPGHLQRVSAGKPITVRLFEISLIDHADYLHWARHARACETLPSRRPATLRLNLPDGKQLTAPVAITYRGVAFCVDDAQDGDELLPESNAEVTRLFGSVHRPEVQGTVGALVDLKRLVAKDLAKQLGLPAYNTLRALPPQVLQRPRNRAAAIEMGGLKGDAARQEREALALEQAGRQLKSCWREHERWPTGEAAYRAAARLALVAYYMGETPVLSCVSGQHFNRRLQADAKLLATLADREGGHLPPMDLDLAPWDSAREALTIA